MDQKLTVITIGGATQDVYLDNDISETGSKIEVKELSYFSGGGATNAAASFVRLGCEVNCVCAVGDDTTGTFVLQNLEREGVNANYIVTLADQATGTSFIVKKTEQERTIFAYRGTNRLLQAAHIPFDAFKKAAFIYITSLPGDSDRVLAPVIAQAQKDKVSVFMNPGKSQLLCAGEKGCMTVKHALSGIHCLIMNASEAQAFMDVEGEQFFHEVLKLGPKIVVVTDGARGVSVGTKDGVRFYPAEHVAVVDSVGAGDAFGSCFAWSLATGKSIEQAVHNGLHNAASVISKLGAKTGLLTEDNMK